MESYRIKEDGGLETINMGSINGMRGCYVSTDYEDKYIFVAGYHDGKLTVLRINDDGSVGEITEEIYYKGLGNCGGEEFRPHISCAKMTRDNHYPCVADPGKWIIPMYTGWIIRRASWKLVDVIRSELESAPRHLKFSKDGTFCILCMN